ncbi:MAG: helix-turn-helix transcriptional regulator [Gemmatimonadaceae bacterium]
MLPFTLQTSRELIRTIAGRVRALRLDRGWTQREIAARAGIAFETYRAFERTGSISLERLMKLAVVLDARTELEQLFRPAPAQSLDELERLSVRDKSTRAGRAGRSVGSRQTAE